MVVFAACVMFPFAIASNPPVVLIFPSVNPPALATSAVWAVTDTGPVKLLLSLRSTAPLGAVVVVDPPTVKGPLCETLPVVLVAVRFPVVEVCPKSSNPPAAALTFPPAVVDPRSNASSAVAVTVPVDFTVPNVRSLVSLIATVPFNVPPAPEPATLTAPWKSLFAPVSETEAAVPFAVSEEVPLTATVLLLSWVMLPLAVALNPPEPKLTLPSSNGVLSAIVAPAPARPTAPLNVFDAFARVEALEPESIVAAPATVSGPFCVIPPVSLRAVRLPPTVVDPRFKAPAESAKRLPAVFTVPRVRAFASTILTEPGTAPPTPEPDALTGPWKSLPEFVSSILEFAPFAVKPAGPATSMVAPLA